MLLTLAFAALASLAASANLSATVAHNPDLTSLSYYLTLIPDITSRLDTSENITVLAPSNEAFQKSLSEPLSQVSQAKIFGFMDIIISYHVLNGTWPTSTFGNIPAFIPTWLEDKIWSSVSGGQVVEGYRQNGPVIFTSGQKNQTTVNTADIHFDGGVLHIVDSVLSLPTNVTDTTAALNMPIATKILSMPGFEDSVDGALSDITVFIPSDSAAGPSSGNAPPFSSQDFNNILGYHMVVGNVLYSSEVKNEQLPTYTNDNEKITIRKVGNEIYVNQAKIIESDILINAGVAHVINGILMPGNSSLPSSIASASQTTSSSSTIVPTSATATPSPTTSNANLNSASTLSPGAYAGIGVGSAVGASAIVAIIVLLCLRRHKRHKQDSDQAHEAFASQRSIRKETRDAKELSSTRMDSPNPTCQELASDMEKYESKQRVEELDSKTIMAQIPQDIYLTRAELGAEDLKHPAYGNHSSANVNDHPLKRGEQKWM